MIDTNAWNRVRYSVYAPFYDPVVRLLGRWRRRSIEILALRPGERVLIMGCGTGLDFEHIPQGVHITAGDITPAMVDRASHRARKLALDADVRVMDAHRLDLPDASFDAVILHLILAVVPDPEAAIREAARVLKPGGRVAIFDKFIAHGKRPSVLRRLAGFFFRIAATDLNRPVEPLIDQGGMVLIHDERVLGGSFFRILSARKT